VLSSLLIEMQWCRSVRCFTQIEGQWCRSVRCFTQIERQWCRSVRCFGCLERKCSKAPAQPRANLTLEAVCMFDHLWMAACFDHLWMAACLTTCIGAMCTLQHSRPLRGCRTPKHTLQTRHVSAALSSSLDASQCGSAWYCSAAGEHACRLLLARCLTRSACVWCRLLHCIPLAKKAVLPSSGLARGRVQR
jgi:hypothetical protein